MTQHRTRRRWPEPEPVRETPAPTRAVAVAAPRPDPIPAAVRQLLQAGRLEQACPCGRWEAAHHYCSACLRRMGPADWYRNGDMDRRIAVVGEARAVEKARPKQSRGPRQGGPTNAQTPVNGASDADTGALPPSPLRATSGMGEPVAAGLDPATVEDSHPFRGSPDGPSLVPPAMPVGDPHLTLRLV